MKLRKIRTKITLALVLVTVLTAVLIGLISYLIFRDVLYSQAADLGMKAAQYNAERIQGWAKEKIASLERTGVHISSMAVYDEAEVQGMLQDAAEADPFFYSVFIGYENGKMLDAKGWIPEAEYNAAQRPWYQLAITANTTVFTPVYLDKNKKNLVTSIALPIRLSGSEGVLAANIPVSNITQQVKSISYGKTGFGILLDRDGMVIAHPEKQYVLQPLQKVFDFTPRTLLNIQRPFPTVETVILRNRKHLLVSVPIEACDWKLLLIAPEAEFLAPVHEMLVYLFSILGIILGLMILLGTYWGRRMSLPIEKMIHSVQRLSEGDLTEPLEIVSEDEFGALSEALNHMKYSLSGMIKNINRESQSLHSYAKNLTDKVEEISSGVTDFVIQISHDLKTPLTLIKGYTKGIQMGVAKEPDKMEEYLSGIYTRAEQIEDITEDILDSLYDTRKSLILEPEELNISDFSDHLLESAKAQIENSGRYFEGSLTIEGGSLSGDRIKLIRVWNNLIANAIKYSDKGSTVQIAINQLPDELELIVRDEGIGIRAEEIDKVFEMFYRTKQRDVKGYGIGLALSRSIIEAHGGRIHATSKYMQGSSFIVKLPLMSEK
ncbi:MAG TPA: sensor histidine kinase [Clostridia bacterium]|nr:sensor histidine kinase [Clostridia bacterium]